MLLFLAVSIAFAGFTLSLGVLCGGFTTYSSKDMSVSGKFFVILAFGLTVLSSLGLSTVFLYKVISFLLVDVDQ